MMYHEAEEVGHWISAYSVSRDLGVLKQVYTLGHRFIWITCDLLGHKRGAS